MNHIDVSTVLRRTVCDLYSNLVTRSTGAAVRTEIEQQLLASDERTITIIDFSNVGLLDLSCADEIVAKLLLRYSGRQPEADPGHDGYFLFRGVHEHHLDAIESVLERHGLALVIQTDAGQPQLVGIVADQERTVWDALSRCGPADVRELADATGLSAAEARQWLDGLCRRRLALAIGDGYAAVGGVR
jgi:hypothetical protein